MEAYGASFFSMETRRKLGALSHPTINLFHFWPTFGRPRPRDANQPADGGGRERSGGDCDWPHLGTHRRAVADPQSQEEISSSHRSHGFPVKSLNLSRKNPALGDTSKFSSVKAPIYPHFHPFPSFKPPNSPNSDTSISVISIPSRLIHG